MPVTYIDDDQRLAQWCAQSHASVLAVDTEFERQKTYFAELCLVQLASGDQIGLLDVPALDKTEPLSRLIGNPQTCVVMHAARQDLEVISQSGLAVPRRLFDTQLAAGLLGFDEQIGYAALAESVLGVAVDKSQTRTDWRRRPLNQAQLDYAAADVEHLGALHDAMCDALRERGRMQWLEEDCAALLEDACHDAPPESAWRRVKGFGGLSGGALARGAALAAWRERTARERNLPRGWLLKDPALVEIAERAPRSAGAMSAVAGIGAGFIRRHGDAVVEVMAGAAALDTSPYLRRAPTSEQRRNAKACATEIRQLADSLGISGSILATRREIDGLVEGDVSARLAQGWRAAVLDDITGRFVMPRKDDVG